MGHILLRYEQFLPAGFDHSAVTQVNLSSFIMKVTAHFQKISSLLKTELHLRALMRAVQRLLFWERCSSIWMSGTLTVTHRTWRILRDVLLCAPTLFCGIDYPGWQVWGSFDEAVGVGW